MFFVALSTENFGATATALAPDRLAHQKQTGKLSALSLQPTALVPSTTILHPTQPGTHLDTWADEVVKRVNIRISTDDFQVETFIDHFMKSFSPNRAQRNALTLALAKEPSTIPTKKADAFLASLSHIDTLLDIAAKKSLADTSKEGSPPAAAAAEAPRAAAAAITVPIPAPPANTKAAITDEDLANEDSAWHFTAVTSSNASSS